MERHDDETGTHPRQRRAPHRRPPQALYDIIADVTRMPELSPEIVSCEWINGATGPAVGAQFRAKNHAGRGPDWHNTPVITVADRGHEFAFSRTE
ncbi:MAG: SRPBCC family protein [Intrasporangiaceae bacterium]|nr:SRPBCC family protein [Intrasporangiaceae bacterium]